jgi:phosphoribosyl 1,2-cyclic phosphodiesterase
MGRLQFDLSSSEDYLGFEPIASSAKGNAYKVTCGGYEPLLLEAGLPMDQLSIATGFSLSKFAGCLISHSHKDHSKAIPALLKSAVDCYMSAETAGETGALGHYRTNLLWAKKVTKIGDWEVTPMDLEHDVRCFGFYIKAPTNERLLFITDTGKAEPHFDRIDILAIECNFMDLALDNFSGGKTIRKRAGGRVSKTHMSLEQVVSMIKASDLSHCRAIWLLHLSETNSDEARMIRTVQEETGIPTRAAKT